MNRRMNAAQAAAAPPQPAYAAPPPQPAPAPTPTPASTEETPSYLAELEQLASLQAAGVISAEEFEAKKRQILGL